MINRRYIHLVLALVLAVLSIPDADAYVGLCCAKCGGNMPMNIPGGGIPETKEFRFKVTPMWMHMEDLRDGTDTLDGETLLGAPASGKFMAVPTQMDMQMLNIALGYSFSDDFFAALMVMYRDNEMEMRFNGPMRTLTGVPGFTMKSSGLGDTMLMTKYRLYADDRLFPTRQYSLFFGLNLPTGSIDEKNRKHPLSMRQTEQLPYGMQLGSGTFDPSAGLLYQASQSPWWWGVNATYTARLYDNDRDYRLGDELRADFYAMFQFRYDALVQLQINAAYQGMIDGVMDEAATGASGRAVKGVPASPYMTPLWDPNNYGGRRIMATFGIQWQPAPLHILDLTFGWPLYQDLNGPQLEESYRVMLTWYIEIPTRASVRYLEHKGGKSKLGF